MSEKTCTHGDCKGLLLALGLCRKHYTRQRKYGDPDAVAFVRHDNEGKCCSATDCKNSARRRGLCDKHYGASRRHDGDPNVVVRKRGGKEIGVCAVVKPDGSVCGKPAKGGRDMCETHYRNDLYLGMPAPIKREWGNVRPCKHSDADGTECGRKAESLGYCQMHYKRFVAHGDTSVVSARGRRPSKTSTYRKFAGVYFFRCGEFIKIGYAADVKSRRNTAQSGNPQDLILLAIEPGDRGLETSLHEKFSHLSHRLEWFHPGEDLVAYIEDVKRNHPQPGMTSSRTVDLNIVR